MFSDTNIVYFRQSYINALFDGNSQEKLESFFKKQFSENDSITYSISDIKSIIEKNKEVSTIEDLNIADDLKNIIYIGKRAAGLSVKTKNIKKVPIFIEGKGYDTYIRNLLPHNDKVWDEQLETIFKQFIDKLVENIVRYNYSILFESQFPKLMKKKIDTQKKKKK